MRYFNHSNINNVSLSGNVFECSNMWMKNWIIENSEKVQNFKAVHCEMKSGKHIKFARLKSADLMCDTTNNVWKILG